MYFRKKTDEFGNVYIKTGPYENWRALESQEVMAKRVASVIIARAQVKAGIFPR